MSEAAVHSVMVAQERSSQRLNIRLNTKEKADYDQLINDERNRIGAPHRLLHEGGDLDNLYNAICESVRPNSRHLINKESILLGVNRKKDSTYIEVYYTRLRRLTPEQRQKISDRFTKKVEVLRMREDKTRAKVEKEQQARERAEQIEHEKRNRMEEERVEKADFMDNLENALTACEAALSSDDQGSVQDVLVAMKGQYDMLVNTVKRLQAYADDLEYGDMARQQTVRCENLIARASQIAVHHSSSNDFVDGGGGGESLAWAQQHINPISSGATQSSSASSSSSSSSSSVSSSPSMAMKRKHAPGRTGNGRGAPRCTRDPGEDSKDPRKSFNTRIRSLDKTGQLLVSRANQHARDAMKSNSEKVKDLLEEVGGQSVEMDSDTANRYQELKNQVEQSVSHLEKVLLEKRKIELAYGMGAKKAEAQFLSLVYGPTLGSYTASVGEGMDQTVKDITQRIFFAVNRRDGSGVGVGSSSSSSRVGYQHNKRFKVAEEVDTREMQLEPASDDEEMTKDEEQEEREGEGVDEGNIITFANQGPYTEH